MNDADFAAIEAHLGEPLPPRYREIMRDWPLNPDDYNSPRALVNDANFVLSLNDMIRSDEFTAWPPRRFVIGSSPCGDSYYLDLTGASPAVFVKYHDADTDIAEAADLDGFVAQLLEWEREAAEVVEAARLNKAKRWRWPWPFGRGKSS